MVSFIVPLLVSFGICSSFGFVVDSFVVISGVFVRFCGFFDSISLFSFDSLFAFARSSTFDKILLLRSFSFFTIKFKKLLFLISKKKQIN